MASEKQLTVFKHLTEGQDKYIYFLLAVAASAVAVAVQQTRDSALAWTQIPLGIAVLSWGLSFWAGCRNRLHHLSALYTNLAMLNAQAGEHPVVQKHGNHPDAIQIATDVSLELMEKSTEKTRCWSVVQFRSLIFGAVCYVVWHVVEMAVRTTA